MNHMKITLLLLLCFLVSFSEKDEQLNDLRKMNLKGNVVSLTEKVYDFTYYFINVDDKRDINKIRGYKFNSDGNIIYYKDELMPASSVNNNGFKLGDYKVSDSLNYLKRFRYNEDNQIKTLIRQKYGKLIFKYNKDNEIIKVNSIANSKYDSINITFQNMSDKMNIFIDKDISSHFYDNEGIIGLNTSLKYNGPKDIIFNFPNGTTIESLYNEEYLEIKRIHKSGDSDAIGEYIYNRNSNGDIVERVYDGEFMLMEDKEIKYQYYYDKNKNWVVRLDYKNDKQTEFTLRDIEYADNSKIHIIVEDLVGAWSSPFSLKWVDLNANGKYNSGKGTEIMDSGMWELNTKDQFISFLSNKGDSKRYSYQADGLKLKLLNQDDIVMEVYYKKEIKFK